MHVQRELLVLELSISKFLQELNGICRRLLQLFLGLNDGSGRIFQVPFEILSARLEGLDLVC